MLHNSFRSTSLNSFTSFEQWTNQNASLNFRCVLIVWFIMREFKRGKSIQRGLSGKNCGAFNAGKNSSVTACYSNAAGNCGPLVGRVTETAVFHETWNEFAGRMWYVTVRDVMKNTAARASICCWMMLSKVETNASPIRRRMPTMIIYSRFEGKISPKPMVVKEVMVK